MKNSMGSLAVVLILGVALFLASHFLSERPDPRESQTPYS